jgi:16S rRNA (guanine527-N7)-methyltransferase
MNTPPDFLLFQRICGQNGVSIDSDQISKMTSFVDMLVDWNKKINLVSRRDVGNIWFSHLLHSIAPWFFLEPPQQAEILDLGTGGGLPGIPLAIVRPDVHLVLLDSIRKKTAAVEDIVRRLGLREVEVMTGRAEDLPRKAPPGRPFDIVLARAVAPLVDLVHWSLPLLRRGGGTGEYAGFAAARPGHRELLRMPCLVALKGGDLNTEILKACREAPAAAVETLNLVFDGSERLGLVDKKVVVVTERR